MTIKKLLILLILLVTFGIIFICTYLFISQPKLSQEDIAFLENIRYSKALADEWTVNDLNNAGFFRYVYNPDTGFWDTSRNNMVRQLMSSRGLALIAQEDESIVPLHKKNLDFVLENWVIEEDEYAYVYFRKKAKLGAFAMLLRTFAASPLYDEYEEIARKSAEGILKLQKENGEFSAWLIEPNYEYDEDRLLTFYSGEALLALAEYYKKTGDERILNAALKGQDAYIVKYVDEIEENYYPAYVPWHVMSLYHLYTVTEDRKYADAAIFLTDRVLELQDVTGNPDTHGRFYNPETPQYGTPHSSSDSVYTEGLVYGYAIAKLVGDKEREQFYKERVIIGAENLMKLQYKEGNMTGAVKARYNKSETRIDNTQHTLDAFNAILEFFETP